MTFVKPQKCQLQKHGSTHYFTVTRQKPIPREVIRGYDNNAL